MSMNARPGEGEFPIEHRSQLVAPIGVAAYQDIFLIEITVTELVSHGWFM